MLDVPTGETNDPDTVRPQGNLARPGQKPPYWQLTLVGSLPVLFLFFADVRNLQGPIMESGYIWGRDFVNVWTGGNLVHEGRLNILYTTADYVAYQRQLVGPIEAHYYSYPPTSLFLAAPLGLLPYFASLAVWLLGTLALFLWAARPYVRQEPTVPLWVAALTPAATVNIWAGHYGFLIGAFWLACYARIRAAPGQAGLFAALLTIKPHLGILIPPLLLLRRNWRVIVVATIGALALALLAGWLFGFDLWRDYLTKTSRLQTGLLNDRRSFFLALMPGTFTALRYATGAGPWAWAPHIGIAAAALFLWWRAVRSGVGFQDLAFISATATFLILPYAFNYDMTVVSLGFALLLFRNWPRLGVLERWALIGGYLSPQLTFVNGTIGLPISPPILLLSLYVQVRLCIAGLAPAAVDRSLASA